MKNTNKNYKLKSCPMCGGFKLTLLEGESVCWIECDTCAMSTRGHRTIKKLIDYWNNRKTKRGYTCDFDLI